MHHHGVSPDDYLEFVHDVPIPEIVPPRPELREMLSGLPGRCVVFTNGSEGYARRVLDALGVAGMMEGIYGIEFMEYIAKPSLYPYAKLLRVTGAAVRIPSSARTAAGTCCPRANWGCSPCGWAGTRRSLRRTPS